MGRAWKRTNLVWFQVEREARPSAEATPQRHSWQPQAAPLSTSKHLWKEKWPEPLSATPTIFLTEILSLLDESLVHVNHGSKVFHLFFSQ